MLTKLKKDWGWSNGSSSNESSSASEASDLSVGADSSWVKVVSRKNHLSGCNRDEGKNDNNLVKQK